MIWKLCPMRCLLCRTTFAENNGPLGVPSLTPWSQKPRMFIGITTILQLDGEISVVLLLSGFWQNRCRKGIGSCKLLKDLIKREAGGEPEKQRKNENKKIRRIGD